MAELETKRREEFGLDFECVLASRFAVAFRPCKGSPVHGIYYFSYFGGVFTRHEGRCLKSTFPDDELGAGDDELLLSPFLELGVKFSDALLETEATVGTDARRGDN